MNLRFRSRVVSAALLLAIGGGASAQPLYQAGITNLADKRCPLWVSSLDNARSDPGASQLLEIYDTWAKGYLKGAANHFSIASGARNPLLSLTEKSNPTAWMQSFCRLNPDQSISNAADAFLEHLKTRQ